MNKALNKLETKKRDQIINSALKEFAENGFMKASTNIIVKNADISKGTLFNYFGSKIKLFNFLEEFVISTVYNSIIDNIDWTIEDFFERVKQVTNI
ncbi:MAG: TetR/AcrR family transcriptional regulator, partial [Bacillota bacterium]|nr:TetR/AcrR family transcriptional regulator [Bacillota bacterium]